MTFHKKAIFKTLSLLSISVAALTLTACGGGGSDSGAGGTTAITPLTVNLDAALAPGESGQISLQTSSDVSKVGVNYQPVNVATVVNELAQAFGDEYKISMGSCPSELAPQGALCTLDVARSSQADPNIVTIKYSQEITSDSADMHIDFSSFGIKRFAISSSELTVGQYINSERQNAPMYFAVDNTTAQLALSQGSQAFCLLSKVSQSGNTVYKLVNNSQTYELCALVVTNAPNDSLMQAYWQYQNNTPASSVVNGKFVINNNVLTQETN